MPYLIDTSFEPKYFMKTSWQSKSFLEFRKTIAGRERNGLPIPKESFPESFTVESGRKEFPDFFKIQPGRDVGVSQKFKNIIESFESGIHQFIPVKALRKNAEEIASECYLFNCLNLVDSAITDGQKEVDVRFNKKIDKKWETVKVKSRNKAVGSNWSYYRLRSGTPLLLDREMVGGRHIWVDQRLWGQFFISDDLYNDLDKAGVEAALQSPEKVEWA